MISALSLPRIDQAIPPGMLRFPPESANSSTVGGPGLNLGPRHIGAR